jgi:hypothetical protein
MVVGNGHYRCASCKKTSNGIRFTLLTSDEKPIKEYADLAKFKKDVTINYLRMLTGLENRIPLIINFLKREYHITD